MTRRAEQLAGEIRRAIQEVLARGLQDPRVSGLVTVTGVKVTGDLRDATIHVSILPEDKQDLALHGLKSAERHIRRECGELIDFAKLPAFHFKLDTSLKKQAAVIADLAKGRDETTRAGAWPGQADAPPAEHRDAGDAGDANA